MNGRYYYGLSKVDSDQFGFENQYKLSSFQISIGHLLSKPKPKYPSPPKAIIL